MVVGSAMRRILGRGDAVRGCRRASRSILLRSTVLLGGSMIQTTPPRKPDRVFDRVFEWTQLAAFAARDLSRGTQLGIVSGRRRQGKTFLLEALSSAAQGFY